MNSMAIRQNSLTTAYNTSKLKFRGWGHLHNTTLCDLVSLVAINRLTFDVYFSKEAEMLLMLFRQHQQHRLWSAF